MMKNSIFILALAITFSAPAYADDLQNSFIESVSDGLSERAEISAGYNSDVEAGLTIEEKKELWQSFIEPEVKAIEPYIDVTFDNVKFNELAHLYMNGVQSQEMAMDCLPSYEALFNVVWNSGYNQRATALVELHDYYGLPIGATAYNDFSNAVAALTTPQITFSIDDTDVSETVQDMGTVNETEDEPGSANTDVETPQTSVAPEKPSNNARSTIESYVRSHIGTTYKDTVINSITINDDLGTEAEGDYIVLAYLTWNVHNSKDTSEKMLKMYSDDLAASISQDHPEVQEIAVFWKVPHLTDNMSKWSYERRGEGMYLTDNILGW